MNQPPDMQENDLDAPPRADFDGVWKQATRVYLRECLELFFPEIAADVDWGQPPVFLDTELERVVRDAHLGQLRADLLVRLARRDGASSVVCLHAEVQSQPDPGLNRRMFRYWTRLTDALAEPVASAVLIGYLEPGPSVGSYSENLWGCRLEFRFPVRRLSDPPCGRAALEDSPSPAAIVALAHVRALETRGDMALRAEEKWRLFRTLHERGLGKRDVLELYRLLDWLLALPRGRELTFRSRVIEYAKENSMNYISSIERFAMEEGMEKGMEKGIQKGERSGLADAVCRQTRKRYWMLTDGEERTVRALPLQSLRELVEALLDFQGRDDFTAWLSAHASESDDDEAK